MPWCVGFVYFAFPEEESAAFGVFECIMAAIYESTLPESQYMLQ